MPCSSRCRQ
jgi:hypothetical protein